MPGYEGAGTNVVLRGATDDVQRGLDKAITDLSRAGRRVLLVVDGMDAWLAMGGVGALDALRVLSSWREVSCSC